MPTPTVTLLLAFDPTDTQTAPYGRFLKASTGISKIWQLSNFTGFSVSSGSVKNGGSGYKVNDVITVTGTCVAPAAFKVAQVLGAGAISSLTSAQPLNNNLYSATLSQPPTGTPVSGGSGTGATLTLVVAGANSTINVPDSKDVPILLSKSSGAIVQVVVQANNCVFSNNLVGGTAWKVAAIFGRGHHSSRRGQQYASPFPVPGNNSRVCCAFAQAFVAAESAGAWTFTPQPTPMGYTYNPPPGANQVSLYIGTPTFLDAGGLDLYEFNVGVTVATPNGEFTFGHDPDMQVDN